MFTAWSASRLDDYTQCPLKAKLKHLDKLCTICFKGKLSGGFDGKPVMCSKGCGPIKKGVALERGDDIGNRLDAYLLGKSRVVPKEIVHPAIRTLLPNVRQEIKKGQGRVQFNVVVNRKWELHRGEPWSPQVWLRGKLDYLYVDGKFANVTDWKTGGVEKKGPEIGKVKAQEKYDDQLDLYNVLTLVTHPEVEEVASQLCFLDCQPPHEPMVRRGRLNRKDLKKAQKRWEKKAMPILTDDTFAPRAGFMCRFCDYQKSKGGPCPYSGA
jgi:hypothetical protein